MITLRDRSVSGVAWSVVTRVAQSVFQFGFTILLARLLMPEDFGMIAIVAVFVGFGSMLGELGFGAAIVQRHQVEALHTHSIFWLNLAAGALLMGLFYGGAPLIAAVYGNPALEPIARILSFQFVMIAVGIVPSALLQRRMEFHRLARVEVLATLLSGLLAVGLALSGWGVWSLVAQSLAASASRSALALALSRWWPRPVFSRAAVRELLGYSVNLVGFNAITYWTRNSDALLIGKFIGTAGLGIYTRAYTVLLLMSQVIGTVLTVLFPALSSIQDDKPRVARIYLRASGVVALITFPIFTGAMVAAEPFVLALFGPHWAAAVPVLQILSAVGILRTLTVPTGWIFTSQGRADLLFRWGLVSSGVMLAAFAVGTARGTVVAVAWAALIAQLILLYPTIVVAGTLVGLRFSEVIGAVGGILACCAAMGGVVWGVGRLLPPDLPSPARLAVQVALGAATYAGLVIGFRIAAFRDIHGVVTERRQRRRLEASPCA